MVLNDPIIALLSAIMGEPVRIASKESIRKGLHRNRPNMFIGWLCSHWWANPAVSFVSKNLSRAWRMGRRKVQRTKRRSGYGNARIRTISSS